MKAKHTKPDDVVLREVTIFDWAAIFKDVQVRGRDRDLLEILQRTDNQPIRVKDVGYVERYSAICRLNGKLRKCGSTGYYLKPVNNATWGETLLQLHVRKEKD
jgi:hypothetical protein